MKISHVFLITVMILVIVNGNKGKTQNHLKVKQNEPVVSSYAQGVAKNGGNYLPENAVI
jgi:hypothetical protein